MRGQATDNKKAVPRKNLETASINRGTTQIAYKICHLFGLKQALCFYAAVTGGAYRYACIFEPPAQKP